MPNAERCAQSIRDSARDVVLDREYVLELDRAIETLRPNLRIVRGVDQLCRDPHAPGVLAHGANQVDQSTLKR